MTSDGLLQAKRIREAVLRLIEAQKQPESHVLVSRGDLELLLATQAHSSRRA